MTACLPAVYQYLISLGGFILPQTNKTISGIKNDLVLLDAGKTLDQVKKSEATDRRSSWHGVTNTVLKEMDVEFDSGFTVSARGAASKAPLS